MKVLLIDNYDSFTYNLFQQIGKVTSFIPDVLKNDKISYEQIQSKKYDCIVLSPGPGRPTRKKDFGVCKNVIKEFYNPLLGVCLGHQGLAAAAGGKIVHAKQPFHGRLSSIYHNNCSIFKGLPQGFKVVRYHSLLVAEPTPKTIAKIAWTIEGFIMAIEHISKPHYGIQFHPESICTEYGDNIISNFFSLAETWSKYQKQKRQ